MKIPLAFAFVLHGLLPFLLPAQLPSHDQKPARPYKPAAFEPPRFFFEHFGPGQGVRGDVSLIRQDRRGYLWCAVKHKGLLRFDGVNFKPYANDPDKPASLPDNDIRDILEDRNGILWLATQTGVIRFDPGLDHFRYVPMRVPDGSWCLLEDSNGRIWVGTVRTGLAYYDPRRDSIVQFPVKSISNGYSGAGLAKQDFDGFFTLTEEREGIIWANAAMFESNGPGLSALVRIDVQGQTGVFYAPSSRLKVPDRWIVSNTGFFFDRNKRIFWITNVELGLSQFSVDTREWRQISIESTAANGPRHNVFHAVYPYNDRMFWLATYFGLVYLDTADGRCAGFTSSPGSAGGCPEGRYTAIYRDRDGTFWFGSDKGLSRLDPYRQQFQTCSPLPADFDAQAIAEYPPTGELFFAACDADNNFQVFAWHPQTGKKRRAVQHLPFRANDIPGVHQVFVAPDRRIWVLLNRGIGWLDPRTLRLSFPDQPIANETARTTGLWARGIAADKDGKLWLATFGSGLVRYDPATREFWRPPELPVWKNAHREFNLFLLSIFSDRQGRIWMGESGTGLEIWDKKTKTRFLCQPQPANIRSVGGLLVNCIEADACGNIWVGTEGGLCRYLPGVSPDSAFERVKGVSDAVLKIVSDAKGRVWMATEGGLYCYDPATGLVKKLSVQEGMTVVIHSRTPFFKSADGHIWLGDDLHFDPEKINLYPLAAKPLITGFRVYDQVVPLSVSQKQAGINLYLEMSLESNQEVFTIEIGALGFSAPEQTRLLFRLQDNDPWAEAGEQRAFTFNRLPGGSYCFSLKAIAPDGTDTGLLAALPLRVFPPFYRAVWFWVLCAAGFAGGIYALFRYREFQRLQQEKLRLRIARDLHDEMGSTLSSISILSEAALRNLQADIDRSRFSIIGERTRQVMEAMSDIVWSVNPRNDTMENVLQRMKEFAVEILEPQGIALHFEAGEAVKSLNMPMEKRKDFYLLFKEAINNAAKYSGASDVWVSVRTDNNGLQLEVRDNGRGFDPALVKRGNGLWNMQRRAERMGGKFVLESMVGKGTRVEVRV